MHWGGKVKVLENKLTFLECNVEFSTLSKTHRKAKNKHCLENCFYVPRFMMYISFYSQKMRLLEMISLELNNVFNSCQSSVIHGNGCMFYRWAWCYQTNLPLKEDEEWWRQKDRTAWHWWWILNRITSMHLGFKYQLTNCKTQTHSQVNERNKKYRIPFVNTFVIWMSVLHWVQCFCDRTGTDCFWLDGELYKYKGFKRCTLYI